MSAFARRFLCTLAALWLLACPGLVQARIQELRQAKAYLQTELRPGQDALEVSGSLAEVQLPYHWDRHFAGMGGAANFESSFDLTEVPTVPYGLYLPRVGNAYAIWVNGALLDHSGDLVQANGDDFAKLPVFVVIPPSQLQKHNTVRIHIRVDRGRRGGLSAILVGPQQEVHALYLRDYWLRSYGAQVVSTLSLLVGLIAMALWVSRLSVRRRGAASEPEGESDILYLMAGLAEFSWAISVSDFLMESPPLPWPWWGMAMVMATTAWACFMALFCCEVARWRTRSFYKWIKRWLVVLALLCLLSLIAALQFGKPLILTSWYLVFGSTFFVFIVCFVAASFKSGSTPHRLVAFAAVVNMAVGIYDLYVLRFSQSYSDNTYLRYTSILFGLTLLYIVIMRFRAVSEHARDLMDNLARRISQREQELAQTYLRLEESIKAQAKSAERARVLRDLHDGVGSHLSVALRQLQTEKYSKADVLHTVSDALDHLKLSIDAINLPAGDITAVLANLRYRLDPRLRESGISLRWQVGKLPIVKHLNDKAMQQLQFIIYGALSNILQHARATEMHIEALLLPSSISLRIADNGVGFDTQSPLRKGLQSMHDRAKAIGAALRIQSEPGLSVVEVDIPLERGEWVPSSQY